MTLADGFSGKRRSRGETEFQVAQISLIPLRLLEVAYALDQGVSQFVKLTPAGEWYAAIPYPERTDILAVDTGKNLTFAAEFEPATLATVQPVLALNRFVGLRHEFIPGFIEGSVFKLQFPRPFRVLKLP